MTNRLRYSIALLCAIAAAGWACAFLEQQTIGYQQQTIQTLETQVRS